MFKLIPSLNANRKHYKTISVDDLITKIKTHNQHVTDARIAGKYTNRPQYDQIKTTKIEAYHPNDYDGISTGYIYLDIDDFKTTEDAIQYRDLITSKFPDLITACWVSLSALGLSILVKSNNVNKTNYNQYWDTLNQLFDNRLDTNSRGYSKVNCISFDPDVYVNTETLPIEEITRFNGSLFIKEDNKEPLNHQINPEFKELKESGINKEPLNLIPINHRTRFEDELYVDINTPLIYPEGIKTLEIDSRYFSKKRIPVGNRTKVIGALSMQLIMMNPLPDGYPEPVLLKQLLNSLLYMNKYYTVEPLSEKEVINIFSSNYNKYKEQGSLDVEKYKQTKYIIWHPECQLSKNDKATIGTTLLAKAKGKGSEFNKQVIYDAVEFLQDGINSITVKRIAEHTGISLSTVKRCYKPFKSLINEYNKSMTMKEEQPTPVQEVKPIVKDNGFDITSMPTTVVDLDSYFTIVEKNLNKKVNESSEVMTSIEF